MRITEEQTRILEEYTCERLTSKEDNRDLIKSFVNRRGYLLVNYLQEYGWEDDKAGKMAFYLIKNLEGVPCVFFAVKCGALFQPLDEDELRKAILYVYANDDCVSGTCKGFWRYNSKGSGIDME